MPDKKDLRLSLLAINGWRGPGSIAIAVAHFAIAADLISYRRMTPIALVVDLFFVLSGLVIAKAYGSKLHHPSAFPEYIVRRFGRIWPLQAATLAILVAYELAKLVLQVVSGHSFSSPAFSSTGPNLLWAIPSNLLLLQSLGLHDRETWVFPSWSLSVEFVTYVSFALFCLLRPLPRRVLTVMTIFVSLAILIFIAPYQMRSTFDYGIFRCLAGFFAGTLCHDLAVRLNRPRWPMPTLVEIGAVAGVIAWMSFSNGTVMTFAAPAVFFVFVMTFMGEGGALSRVLRMKPLQFLAELSFAIYMVHAIILVLMFAVLHEWERHTGSPLFSVVANPLAGHPGASQTVQVLHVGALAVWTLAIVYILSVFLSAFLAYRFVEVPGRLMFAHLSKRFAYHKSTPPMGGADIAMSAKASR